MTGTGAHDKRPSAVYPASPLPPNPSIGELVTEIDSARHDAARTMGALVAKLDVSSRVKRATHERVRAIRWDGRRLVADLRAAGRQLFAATPEALKGGRMWPIVIVATVLLVRRLRRRRAAG